MKNADILEMLNEISNYLDREEYQKASNYIVQKKMEINTEDDPSSEYIEKFTVKVEKCRNMKQ